MNRLDYTTLLEEVEKELTEPGGTFRDLFGEADEKEREKNRYIAAIALMAADRLYSNITRTEFDSTKNA